MFLLLCVCVCLLVCLFVVFVCLLCLFVVLVGWLAGCRTHGVDRIASHRIVGRGGRTVKRESVPTYRPSIRPYFFSRAVLVVPYPAASQAWYASTDVGCGPVRRESACLVYPTHQRVTVRGCRASPPTTTSITRPCHHYHYHATIIITTTTFIIIIIINPHTLRTASLQKQSSASSMLLK